MMSKFKYLVAGMMLMAAGTQANNLNGTTALASATAPVVTSTGGNETSVARPAKVSTLMATIEKGHLIDAKEMINAGADIKEVSADGQTALHFAARKGYIELVKKLINEGADVNARDAQGRTALDMVNQTEYKFPREKRAITRMLSEKQN